MRRISATESPPNFSTAASASTSATIASATTAAAGTAHTSERWLIAVAGSPVVTSTVARARFSDEMGFMAAFTRSGSPVVMPPSRPPARSVIRRTPVAVGTISSCASEPRERACCQPSPISTPLIAWIDMSAVARRASSLRSHCTWLPRPGGTPYASTSTTPPSVSAAFFAASTSATIRALASASRQRSGSASMRAASSGVGRSPGLTATGPSSTTWETISMPSAWRTSALATVPTATRAAVSRALARSRIGRASVCPYFCMPARSA